MDHLPLPLQPFYPARIEIPYLAGGRWTYDGLGLASFPERNGSSIHTLQHGPGPHDTPNDALALLQSWLFFGLLHETFKASGIRVDSEDFINLTESGQQVVTTEMLPQLISVWETSEASLLKSKKNRHLSEIDKSLSIAATALTKLVNATWLQEPGLPTDILLSLIMLSETMLHAREEIYKDRMLRIPTAVGSEVFTRLPPVGYVDRLLRGAGWCPFEVQMLRHQVKNTSRYYLSMLDRTPEARQHQRCTVSQCILNVMKRESYRCSHVADSCHCPHLVSEDEGQSRVSSILRSGHTPLVVVSSRSQAQGDGDPGSLTVISSRLPGLGALINHTRDKMERQNYASWAVKNPQSKPSIPYVAVSHVWRGGLGNPNANSLPWCQLRRIQDLVNGLYNPPRLNDMPFWMDTLCVPLNPEHRRLAIEGMKGVYQAAEKVIVLDTFLESCELSTSATQNLMEIQCSSWMQRLWTFQEGILARSLHFQFKGTCIRGEELLEGLVRSRKEFVQSVQEQVDCLLKTRGEVSKTVLDHLLTLTDSVAGIHVDLDRVLTHDIIASDARRCFKRLRFSHSYDSHTLLKKRHEAEILSKLSHSLQWRRTTRAEDEALVLTNLLGLSTKDLLDARAEITMKRVFASMSSVPLDVLFTPQEHMDEPGCSWMPKSLINGQGRSILNPKEGLVTGQGLKVHLPGIMMGDLKHSSLSMENGECVFLRIKGDTRIFHMRVVHSQHNLHGVVGHSGQADDSEIFAVILERSLPKLTATKGALVRVKRKMSSRQFNVSWIGVVTLQQASSLKQEALDCTMLTNNQQWCVQ